MRCPLCERDDCNGLRHSFGEAVGNGPQASEGTADSGWIKIPSQYEAGFRAGIEAAAKLLDTAAASIHPELQLHERYDAIKKFATSTAATVRKLAPATKEEPK